MSPIIKQVYVRIRNTIAIAARLLLLQPQATTMAAGVTSSKTGLFFFQISWVAHATHGHNIDPPLLGSISMIHLKFPLLYVNGMNETYHD